MVLGRINAVLIAVLVGIPAFSESRISLGANVLSIEAPEGFTAMAPDVRARIFPEGGGPAYIFRKADENATVTFDTLKQEYTKKDLGDIKARSENSIASDKRPLRWVARETTKLQGHPCVHLEFVRTTEDGDVHEDQYYVLQGRAVSLLSFSGPEKEFGHLQPLFQKSRASIRFAR